MSILREFIWGHDAEFGIDGWIPKHNPQFNAGLEGFGLAHDVLEHHSATDASLDGEFRAFGAMLYLRAEGNYWANTASRSVHHHPASIMYSDISRFCVEAADQNRHVPRPPNTRPLDEELESIIADINRMAEVEIVDEAHAEGISAALRILSYVTGWMRIGYRQAARRWKCDNPWQRINLFAGVTQAIDEVSRHGDFGDTLQVRVNPRTFAYDVKIKHGWGNE